MRTRATITLPAGPTTIRAALRVDPDWRPRSGTFDTTLRGRTTRVTLQQRGNTVESMMPCCRRAPRLFTRPTA